MTVPKLYDAVFQRGESRWRLFALKSRSFEGLHNLATKRLCPRPRASYGVSPNSRIELLAVFALEIFGEWFAGINLTSVRRLQCELL